MAAYRGIGAIYDILYSRNMLEKEGITLQSDEYEEHLPYLKALSL